MGGECKAGEEGWEIGVYGNEVTEEGKRWWGDVSGQGRDDKVVSPPSWVFGCLSISINQELELTYRSSSSKWYASLSTSLLLQDDVSPST